MLEKEELVAKFKMGKLKKDELIPEVLDKDKLVPEVKTVKV